MAHAADFPRELVDSAEGLTTIWKIGFPSALALQNLTDTVQSIIQAQFGLGQAVLLSNASLAGESKR